MKSAALFLVIAAFAAVNGQYFSPKDLPTEDAPLSSFARFARQGYGASVPDKYSAPGPSSYKEQSIESLPSYGGGPVESFKQPIAPQYGGGNFGGSPGYGNQNFGGNQGPSLGYGGGQPHGKPLGGGPINYGGGGNSYGNKKPHGGGFNRQPNAYGGGGGPIGFGGSGSYGSPHGNGGGKPAGNFNNGPGFGPTGGWNGEGPQNFPIQKPLNQGYEKPLNQGYGGGSAQGPVIDSYSQPPVIQPGYGTPLAPPSKGEATGYGR